MKSFILSFAILSSAWASRPIPENEYINRLLEGKREVRSLKEIAERGLNEGKTEIDLWSGSYWPHYQGSLGVRYRESSFRNLIESEELSFTKYQEALERKPLYIFRGRENDLSPAEKYDLLVGDESYTLTKYSWGLGEKAALVGNVPFWRGICDGWSSASQMMPRPRQSVVVTTPKGVEITFYPEDLKALGSLLYARAQDNVIFLGKRCYSRLLGPFTDACQGTNPGAFHKALINRVGNLKKSLVADVSRGSEVWNYPVASYKITYYNVFDDQESANFKDVLEPFNKKQRFSKAGKRHDDTYAIVGVKAEVTFSNMRKANLAEVDDASADEILTKTYWYDLELDYKMNILGGEWATKDQPDFIWAPNDRTYPLSDVEKNRMPLTERELRGAAQVASKQGQPLSIVVQRLFELAK